MRTRLLTSAALLVVLAGNSVAADESPSRIAGLIAKLASPRYAEREAASRSLDALGDVVLEPLRAALRSDDAEVRRRAAHIIETVELRQVNERLLKPTTIALEFHNSPLPEAVAALKRHTGLEILLSDQVARRNVTVSSKPLPVWEAIELFCRKAELREWDGYGSMPPGFSTAHQQRVGPGQIIVINGRGRSTTRMLPGTDGRVMLYDGPAAAAMSFHAGSVRVRVLPSGTPFPSTQADRDEVVLPLHVSAEARLANVSVLSATVERAINERGQVLPAVELKPEASHDNEVVVFNGQVMQSFGRGRGTQIALRLKQGDQPSQSLSELRGHLAVDAVIDDTIATADARGLAGTAFTSPCGVNGRIDSVERTETGTRYTIDFDVPPAVSLATGPGEPQIPQFNNAIVRRGANLLIGMKSPTLPAGTRQYAGLSLDDANGRQLEVASGSWERIALNGIGGKYQVEVTFRHRAGEGVRLVAFGKRPATILVPFAFKDVPLQ